MQAITCRAVHKSFGDRKVLDDITIDVDAGEFFGLIGMNGSGKSTMIKAILDLIAVDAGTIELFDVPHRQVHARNEVAFLPDRFSPPAHLRCKDFLDYMLELHGSSRSDEEISACLESMELPVNVMMMSVSKLSKGMTQKLGLASCLLSDKSLLILDEPMSGLDPKSRYLFKQQLLSLKEKGTTVFFSSHVLADVEEMSDTMAVLHRNRIRYTGTTESFVSQYEADSLEQAYMSSIED